MKVFVFFVSVIGIASGYNPSNPCSTCIRQPLYLPSDGYDPSDTINNRKSHEKSEDNHQDAKLKSFWGNQQLDHMQKKMLAKPKTEQKGLLSPNRQLADGEF